MEPNMDQSGGPLLPFVVVKGDALYLPWRKSDHPKRLCSCLGRDSRRQIRHGRRAKFNLRALPCSCCLCSNSTSRAAIVLVDIFDFGCYCSPPQVSSGDRLELLFTLLRRTLHTSGYFLWKNEAVPRSSLDLKLRYQPVPVTVKRRSRIREKRKSKPVDNMTSSSQWAEIKRAQVDTGSAWASIVEKDNDYWVIDLYFKVYLDHMTKDEDAKITLHASIIYAKKTEAAPIAFNHPGDAWYHYTKHSRNKPMLAYLCGGPGDENTYTKVPTINANLVERGYQVLHLDYRGTGKSTKLPGCAAALQSGKFRSSSELATYLSHFTQDKIAQDLEAVRLCLSDLLARDPSNLKLTLLAQSFGGWIALTYLSYYPTSLTEVLLTAAMPPFTRTPQEVYAKLYERVINRNEAYYALYPSDASLLRKIVSRLFTRQQKGISSSLPDNSGRPFGYDVLLTLGRLFGGAGRSGFDKVHNFLQQLWADLEKAGSTGPLPAATLAKFASKDLESFRLHQRPIYGLLHEAIYCHGPTCKSNWAAKSVGLKVGGTHKSQCTGSYAWLGGTDGRFNPSKDFKSDTKVYFTGEMILPGMLDGASAEVAEILARRRDANKNWGAWPYTYDPTRLGSNLHNVPVKSVVYKGDMYVDWETSLDMGSKVGGPCKVWLVAPSGDVQLAVEGGKKLPIWVDQGDKEMEGLWDWVHGAVKAQGKTEKVLGLLFDGTTW